MITTTPTPTNTQTPTLTPTPSPASIIYDIFITNNDEIVTDMDDNIIIWNIFATSPTPTPSSAQTCTLISDGYGQNTFVCNGGTLISIYYKGTFSFGLPDIGGKFYKTQSNCTNNIDDWNSYFPYYYSNNEKFAIASNGEITNREGCS